MILWIILALMTGAAVLAVLWPLSRGGRVAGRAAGDRAVYRDQLQEIERDRALGLIGEPEAEAARIEVSRRLIAAAEADAAEPVAELGAGAVGRRKLAAVAVLLVVPAVGLGVYGRLGSPDLPDAPLEARLDGSLETASLDALVARVESHLAADPKDGRGWEVLAPIYLRAGRLQDAKQAYGRALALLGSTPAREADFGEAAVALAGRVVTAEAKAAFGRAIVADPASAKAHYYLGLAQEQDGDRAGAAKAWQAALADTPADSSAAAFLTAEIDRVSGATGKVAGAGRVAQSPEPAASQPGPTTEQMAAADQMAPADRNQMIRGMVDGLAARLRQDGSDPQGWVRLMRAYLVLGDRDRAITARTDAQRALAGAPDSLKTVTDAARGLGLES